MHNEDTDVIFPPRIIPHLQNLRGVEWRGLVEKLLQEPADSPGRLAFVLLMVRLGGCMTCHADSYRAMRGCTPCASQTIKRFRGSDQELLHNYSEAMQEIERYLNKKTSR